MNFVMVCKKLTPIKIKVLIKLKKRLPSLVLKYIYIVQAQLEMRLTIILSRAKRVKKALKLYSSILILIQFIFYYKNLVDITVPLKI